MSEVSFFTSGCSVHGPNNYLTLIWNNLYLKVVNPSNDSGKLSCKNGQKEVCCPSGTQVSPSDLVIRDIPFLLICSIK